MTSKRAGLQDVTNRVSPPFSRTKPAASASPKGKGKQQDAMWDAPDDWNNNPSQGAPSCRCDAALVTGVESTTTSSDLSDPKVILAQFDADPAFGPMSGLTRLERWDRAQAFGLNPPARVREYILASQQK